MTKNYYTPSMEVVTISSCGLCQAASKFEFTNAGATDIIDPENGGL